jgi:hypothetical protein
MSHSWCHIDPLQLLVATLIARSNLAYGEIAAAEL